MTDIFTSNILHTVVQLQPSEFNDSIDQTILINSEPKLRVNVIEMVISNQVRKLSNVV